MSSSAALASLVVSELKRRGHTIAVAESLTGGLLAAEFVSIAGASAVFTGGVVAYNTATKHSVLGVDAELLAERGAVDAEVARQMASAVRRLFSVNGRPADFGLATTGVAGPSPQDGHVPGVAFVALASADGIRAEALRLHGDREAVRQASVRQVLALCAQELGLTRDE